MTPEDLRAWQKRMGISALEASRRLGVSQMTYLDWVQGTSRTTGKPIKLPPLLRWACAGMEAGVTPLGSETGSI